MPEEQGRAPRRRRPTALLACIFGSGSSGQASSARCTRGRPAWPAHASPASPRRRLPAPTRPRPGSARGHTPTQHALVTDPDVDIVCTPNHLHAPLAEAALEAGKHVVCEKPLATDAAQAARLEQAADASGRVATGPFAYRYHPMAVEARARVAAGELGGPRAPSRRLPPGLAVDGRGGQLAPGARARRRVPRVRRHRLPLVRPRRVHHRRPDRRAVRADRHGGAGARAPRRRRAPSRPVLNERPPRRTTEDLAIVLVRTQSGVLGTGRGQPGLAWPQEPPARRDRGGARQPPLRAGTPRDAVGGPTTSTGRRWPPPCETSGTTVRW
jgi:Oxidoreductase family, NAD-binding Rossmann fold